jgi:hypothetical protein
VCNQVISGVARYGVGWRGEGPPRLPPVRPILALAVLRRPRLWLEAGRALLDTRCKQWWKRLLLVPESDYLRWRTATAYGDPEAPMEAADLVRYLQWRRRQREE